MALRLRPASLARLLPPLRHPLGALPLEHLRLRLGCLARRWQQHQPLAASLGVLLHPPLALVLLLRQLAACSALQPRLQQPRRLGLDKAGLLALVELPKLAQGLPTTMS